MKAEPCTETSWRSRAWRRTLPGRHADELMNDDISRLLLCLYSCIYKSLKASPQHGQRESNNAFISKACDQKLAGLTCELASWKAGTPHLVIETEGRSFWLLWALRAFPTNLHPLPSLTPTVLLHPTTLHLSDPTLEFPSTRSTLIRTTLYRRATSPTTPNTTTSDAFSYPLPQSCLAKRGST